MDRTRHLVAGRYVRVFFNAARHLRGGPAMRMAILTMLCLVCSPVLAQLPTDGIQGVYPAQSRQGQTSLYGILQQLPPPPRDIPAPQSWRNGVLLRVMVTAGPASRGQSGAAACRQCTAQHFFLIPSEFPTGAHRKLRALRHPPGQVTYLDVKGKEYALFHIRVRRTEAGLLLTGATLMRTGFVPPILKKRLRLRFDVELPAGAARAGIVATALADTRESMPDAR